MKDRATDALAVVGSRHTMKELVDGTIRVQIDIDPPYREAFLKQFSEVGVAVGLVRLNEEKPGEPTAAACAALPEPKQEPREKPYGQYARELHRLGWWWQPGVLEAIGTDQDFLVWVRQQPCAMTGEYDRNEDAHGNEIKRCEAAHVRRIANGAGTAEKPPFAAIPLVHYWHAQQTIHGEGVFAAGDREAGRKWMDAQRQKYVIAWASETLARALGAESMGYVEPHILVAWAEAHGLGLPNKYHGTEEKR